MNFDICIHPQKYYYNQNTGHFHQSKKFLRATLQSITPSTPGSRQPQTAKGHYKFVCSF